MPNLIEATPAVHDQDRAAVIAGAAHSIGAFASSDGLQAQLPLQERVASATDADASGPNQMIGSGIVAELPPSHRNVDPADISVEGLLQKCSRYRKIYEANPEAGRAEAVRMVHKIREVQTMREQGKSDQEIRSKLFADNLRRAKERAKVERKEQPKPEPPKPDRAERAEQHVIQLLTLPGTSDPPGNVRPAPERVPLPVARAETADKSEVSSPESASPQVSSLHTKAQAAPMHEAADRALYAAQLNAERAYMAAAESDSGIAGRAVLFDASPAPVAEPAFYDQHLKNIAAETERIAVRQTLPGPAMDIAAERTATPYNAVLPPDQLLFGGPVDAIETAQDEELTFSPAAARPSLENGGVIELPEQTAWDDILEKEPPELFNGFAEALQSLLAPPEETTVTFDETPDTDEPVVLVGAVQELRPAPAIAVTVAERLTGLDAEGKEAAAPLLREVVGVLRLAGDVLMAAEDAGPGAVETTQAKLGKLTAALFERLVIEYEPEDIERFVAVLLRPDFQPVQFAELAFVDLEHKGTREAKLHFAQLVSDSLSDVKETAGRLLGRLVVFYAAHHIPLEREPAAV